MSTETLHKWLTLVANIGVLIGLGLLIYEIRQNSELMSAEIHSIRAEGKASRQMSLANEGEIATILAKATVAGFPESPGAFAGLSLEEKIRLRLMYTAILEATANWHVQCQRDLLNEETCATTQRVQLIQIVPMARAVDVDFVGHTPSFIKEVQRIAREEGFLAPNDDGTWPEKPE